MSYGNALNLPSNGNLIIYLTQNYVIVMLKLTLQCNGYENSLLSNAIDPISIPDSFHKILQSRVKYS